MSIKIKTGYSPTGTPSHLNLGDTNGFVTRRTIAFYCSTLNMDRYLRTVRLGGSSELYREAAFRKIQVIATQMPLVENRVIK